MNMADIPLEGIPQKPPRLEERLLEDCRKDAGDGPQTPPPKPPRLFLDIPLEGIPQKPPRLEERLLENCRKDAGDGPQTPPPKPPRLFLYTETDFNYADHALTRRNDATDMYPKELNPFAGDDDEITYCQLEVRASPRLFKTTTETSYPEHLNPFFDDEDCEVDACSVSSYDPDNFENQPFTRKIRIIFKELKDILIQPFRSCCGLRKK